jgi:hypothetical protein
MFVLSTGVVDNVHDAARGAIELLLLITVDMTVGYLAER